MPVIRSLRGKLLNDDYLALATLLVKAGYMVRLTSDLKPGGKTRETVLEFEEGVCGTSETSPG